MNEKISVIVPVFNAEEKLVTCLESIMNQSYRNLEIILIDDGSTDKSPSVCDEYATRDIHISVLHKQNSGVSAARNDGLQISTGEYIMFVDSDDWIEYNMCQVMLDNIMATESQLAICGINVIQAGERIRTPHLSEACYYFKQKASDYWYLRKINLAVWNKLYKKEYITSRFDTSISLGEDTIFVVEYMLNIRMISVIESCLYNVCLDNPNSLNRKEQANRLDLILSVRSREETLLETMYPQGCDKTPLYNECFAIIYSTFEIMAVSTNSREFGRHIEKYFNENNNHLAKEANFSQMHYRIMQKLFISQNSKMIFCFLKLKRLLISMLRGASNIVYNR